MNKADILRKKFLDYFKARKHKVVESDSLVPHDDPTVLFTPAGMNQFKKQFMGLLSGFGRAASSQRCLRTDDLDKVGKTSGHHTFFEMLGNFSFGDYFKKDAITWAWEFLTEELKIDKNRLWVSVYKDDLEAYEIWKDIVKVPKERILKLGDKDNFWPAEAKEKGPNGPCGPCSEIFYDYGKDVGCGTDVCDPTCSCSRFVEVWNLVFTQYNRKDGGALEPLPKKNIDTGMGLERLTAVMQGVKNNFETDLFQPIIKEIAAEAGNSPRLENAYAIADHIRAAVFSIYDGVLPSNEGRGYIVRKLLRKSTLHLKAMGIKKLFLYKLVPIVAEIMQEPYPELTKLQENISGIVLAEEKNFISTLESSGVLCKEKFADFVGKGDPITVGKIVFQLYDTYGLPLELTTEWLAKNKIEFSKKAFESELEEQKKRSKTLSTMKGDVFTLKELHLGVKPTKFLGYKDIEAKTKILKIIKNGKEVKKAGNGEYVTLILDETPFYAESGGQVGDSGEIIKGKNVFAVENVERAGKIILHSGKVKSGSFKKADTLSARVDAARRLSIARNHTATHLLQAALRKVLGAHVQQQGSLVTDERLRFDFSHFKSLSQEELIRVEEEVNRYVLENRPLCTKSMELSQAKKTGALAFFAEKYEGKVRVVSVEGVSSELCGGTHLDYTGTVGLFRILHEGSVASGVRRIEAVSGEKAFQAARDEQSIIQEVSGILRVPAQKISAELEKKLNQIKELEKQAAASKSSNLMQAVENKEAQVLGKINFVLHIDTDKDAVRRAVDLIKAKAGSNTIVLSTTADKLSDQIFLAIGVTEDLCSKGVDANKLIKEISQEVGGSGGGRRDFAQAGGNNPQNFSKALDKLREIISKI